MTHLFVSDGALYDTRERDWSRRASALWNRMREDCPDLDGHALRARFRKEYGAAFARRHWA